MPPTHDLETLCCWLQWARDAGVSVSADREQFEIAEGQDRDDSNALRFDAPRIVLQAEQLEAVMSHV